MKQIASPAGSPTRFARIGSDSLSVEFSGYRYDFDTGLPVASTWVVTAASTALTGYNLFAVGEQVELFEDDLLPLVVAINLPPS